LELSKAQKKELIHFRDRDARPDIRERCAAILKIAEGQPPYAVAQHGLLKRRRADTVYRWLNRYEEMGIEGLLTRRHGGNRRGPFRQA
jgi:transposase